MFHTQPEETSAMSKCTIPSFVGQVIFCGFDVHKDKWSVCVRHCGREIAAYPAPADARAIAGKLRRDYPDADIRSVYEAGFSGFEAHRILVEEYGIRNIVINPADVPTNNKERTRKSDRIDCRKLARTLEAGLLEPIYVPSRDHLQFRNLVRRHTRTTSSLTRTINQLKSHWYFNGEPVPTRVCRRVLASRREQALRNGDYTSVSLIDQYFFLIELRKTIRTWEHETILQLNLSAKMKNLVSIPGIGFRTATVILSEIWDVRRFPDKDHLASYAGFAPYLVGSGEKEETVGADCRKHKLLHYILIQAAWRAARSDPEMICLYGKLQKRRHSPQRIACIIAKKLLFIARAVLLEDREYRSAGAGKKKDPLRTGSGAAASCPPPSPTGQGGVPFPPPAEPSISRGD
jgi:transposase